MSLSLCHLPLPNGQLFVTSPTAKSTQRYESQLLTVAKAMSRIIGDKVQVAKYDADANSMGHYGFRPSVGVYPSFLLFKVAGNEQFPDPFPFEVRAV
jgi:hypothetical protein